jgi:hypothetical protein
MKICCWKIENFEYLIGLIILNYSRKCRVSCCKLQKGQDDWLRGCIVEVSGHLFSPVDIAVGDSRWVRLQCFNSLKHVLSQTCFHIQSTECVWAETLQFIIAQ